MSVLEIKDLHVEIEGKEILKGVNLTLKTGEIAAIMGPMVLVNRLFLPLSLEILTMRLPKVKSCLMA